MNLEYSARCLHIRYNDEPIIGTTHQIPIPDALRSAFTLDFTRTSLLGCSL